MGADAIDFEDIRMKEKKRRILLTNFKRNKVKMEKWNLKKNAPTEHRCRLKRPVELLAYLRNGNKNIVRAIINETDGDIINVIC